MSDLNVHVRAATLNELATLENMMQLYCHDMSEYVACPMSADGRFSYPFLSLYFQEPGRSAFLTLVDGQLAGFALARRGSPATYDPAHLDVAEFFVLRAQRRRGVGERAAALLWTQLPGHWVVRVAERNVAGLAFWRRAVRAFVGQGFSERVITHQQNTQTVLEFG